MDQVLGISRLSEGQEQILKAIPRAIKEYKPIVIPSGNAQGKDFLASCIAPWFSSCYSPSKTIITAPTDRQVKEIMWSELETRYNKAIIRLPGRVLTCKVDIAPDWFIIGFTTKETGQMTGKAQGFHSRHVCVIASEAQAIQDNIFEQLDSILNAEVNLFIMIGNPLRTTGKFARAIDDTTNNIVINLDCLDSPNYLYKRTMIPGMASYDWIEKKRKEWNPEGTEDHPLWLARVRGKKPKTSIDTIFSHELVEQGVKQIPRVSERKIVVSNDPARFGDDECVTYGGISGRIAKTDILPQSSGPTVCSHVLQVTKEMGANHIIMEVDGLGGPIADFVDKIKPSGVTLQTIYMNGKPEDELQYQNARAEMYFYAKHQVEKGKVQIPNDEYLKQELEEVKYFYNVKGKIQLEDKEDLKERIGRSPNRADAWVLNIWGQKDSVVVRNKDAWDDEVDTGEVISRVTSAMSA